MAILASEIHFYKSTAQGPGTGGATISSLGGAITASQLTSGLLNDLFDDVSAAESTTGRTEYRCIYIQNTNVSLTLQGAVLWIASNAPNANVNCSIGLDPAGKGNVATTIATEDTPPGGVVFTQPDAGTPFALGDLATTEFYAFWIRRVVAPGATASAADNVVLGFSGASDP